MKRTLILLFLSALSGIWGSQPASAHVTVFADTPAADPLQNAYQYPVEGTIEPLFAINGFLSAPNQVDYVTFTAEAGERFVGFTMNPSKHGARAFSPDFALIGPGLPAPQGPVPFLIPDGYGALLFPTPDDREVAEEQLGYGPLLEGPLHEVEITTPGKYYVAVYDPEGRSGHYLLSIGSSEDEDLIPDIERYTIPAFGDVKEDGVVNVEDALLVLQAVVRKADLTSRQKFAGDVGMREDRANFVSPGNGVIGLGDAIRILRRATGLEGGEGWPFDG